MRRQTITDAKNAAERLIEAIDAFEAREEADDHFRRMNTVTGVLETGALRRARLDLTRALADMRKP